MANADVTVEFDSPEEVAARMTPVVNAGLRAAAAVVTDAAVRNIKDRPAVKFPGRKVGASGAVSLPGETPTTQTAAGLRTRIHFTEPENGETFVGTDLDYGRYLELGTSKMAPRPWLLRSVNEARLTAQARAIRAARAKFAEVFGG